MVSHSEIYFQKLGHKRHKRHNRIKTPINKRESECDVFVTFCDVFNKKVLKNLYNVTDVTEMSRCNRLSFRRCDVCDVCDVFFLSLRKIVIWYY